MNVTIGALTQPPVSYAVKKYKMAALGGPKDAEIEARGNEADLWGVMNYLGRGITIDHGGRSVWWGDIEEIQLHLQKITWILTRKYMANRLAVAYELVAPGQQSGTRQTTAYTEDATSIARYGIKELLESSPGTTAAHAELDRDQKLTLRKKPMLYWEPGGSDGDPYVTIYGRGYWDTLEWRYATVPVEFAMGYQTIGTLIYGFGEGDGGGAPLYTQKIAQAFDVGPTAINAAAVEVYIAKYGTGHADNITVSIYENPDDDEPGTQLASGTILTSTLTTDYAWHMATFTPITLAANTSYYVITERSGSPSASAFYRMMIDQNQGYPAGPCKRYFDGGWIPLVGDAPFRIYADAVVPTSQQLKSLLTCYGQFFTKVKVDIESGVSVESYQDGDSTALDVINHLLEMGTTNNRRLLATVDEFRQVKVFEEPAGNSTAYFVDNQLNIFDVNGVPVEKYTCPVGQWMRPTDQRVNIESALQSLQAGMFIEEMEYNPETDELTPSPRSIDDLFDAGAMERG